MRFDEPKRRTKLQRPPLGGAAATWPSERARAAAAGAARDRHISSPDRLTPSRGPSATLRRPQDRPCQSARRERNRTTAGRNQTVIHCSTPSANGPFNVNAITTTGRPASRRPGQAATVPSSSLLRRHEPSGVWSGRATAARQARRPGELRSPTCRLKTPAACTSHSRCARRLPTRSIRTHRGMRDEGM